MTTGTLFIDPILAGSKNFFRNYANLVLGVDQSEAFSKSLKESVFGIKDPKTKAITRAPKGFQDFSGSFRNAFEDSKKALIDTKTGETKSFWKTIKDSFKHIPDEFKLAKAETKVGSKIWKTLGIAGKRMPLIGNLFCVAMALPTIYQAFTKGGVGTGVAEVGKEGAKLGGFAVGAAIGSIIPGIGTLIGGLVGGFIGQWCVEKVTGKTFIEKQQEAQANSVDGVTGADARPQTDATTGADVATGATVLPPDANMTKQQLLTQQLLGSKTAFTGGADYQSLLMNSNNFGDGDPLDQDFMGAQLNNQMKNKFQAAA